MATARRPGPLESSVTQALAAMKWIEASDKAAVDLTLLYARQIDTFTRSKDPQVKTKGIYLGPHLLRALVALGGTPTARLQHELRSRKLAGPEAEGDHEDAAETKRPAGNVTSIKRPPRRYRSG